MAQPTLYDAYGRQVQRQALLSEEGGPTLRGVRQILGDHPAQGLTPGRLASILLAAEEGDPTAYLELAEEMEEKDLHYLSVLSTRKRAVAQLDITIEAASDDRADRHNADLVEQWLTRDVLEDELFDILDAVGKGYSATEIDWDTAGDLWLPRRLIRRDPRWFVFDETDGETVRLRTATGSEELSPYKWIVHQAKVKSGLPIRGGLARMAAWVYLFKNYTIKDWVQFLEVYGQPLRVGKYHAGASKEDRRILLQAVANLGTDAAAIMPDSMMVEFVEAAREGSAEVYERMANYLDKQLSKGVLGQTLTTEVGSEGGSYAASQTHNDVRGDIQRSDAKQLGATLNRDLIRAIVDLNRGPQKAYPRAVVGLPEAVNMEALGKALPPFIDRGLRISQRTIRTKFGLAEPDDGDEMLQPAGASAQPPATAQQHRRLVATTTAAQAEEPERSDAVDDLVDEALADWQPVMKPLVDPVRELVANASSLEEIRDALAGQLAKMNVDELAELLARAGFVAKVGGELEVDLG